MGSSRSCLRFFTLCSSAERCSVCPAFSFSLWDVGSNLELGSKQQVLAWLPLHVQAGELCSLPVTLSQTPRVQMSKCLQRGSVLISLLPHVEQKGVPWKPPFPLSAALLSAERWSPLCLPFETGESTFWHRKDTLIGCCKPYLLSSRIAKCIICLPGNGLVS